MLHEQTAPKVMRKAELGWPVMLRYSLGKLHLHRKEERIG